MPKKSVNTRPAIAPPEDLLRPNEACAALGICEKTLRNWVKRGYIVCSRIGPKNARYRRADVERLLGQRA